MKCSPPRHLAELRVRADALAGRTVGELAAALGVSAVLDGGASQLHAKGRVGELLERALGASAGSTARPDFPELGVELKTIPVDQKGRPRESTFVCSIALAGAEDAEWNGSRLRTKLAHVLWVPIVDEKGGSRRIGQPRFWRPTPAQEEVLRGDFEDLIGLIGAGGIERLSAHAGRWLQIRPKAQNGRVRTEALAFDGAPISTVPRGFYLRARFTGALLLDGAALPP